MEDFSISIDNMWTLIAAFLVMFMQPGFALVEAGMTRTKNTANILMKNILDYCIGTVVFWFVGFGIMYGKDLIGFIGDPNGFWAYAVEGMGEHMSNMTTLLFQTVFAATSATIVSGAMAERTNFKAYLVYSLLISLYIYPISGHWGWGGGWLSNLGFHDFAGSTLVHSVGGWLALTGAIILGPRVGKYKNGKAVAIPGHSLSLATLGVFILWFAWFGFNCGSTVSATGGNMAAIGHIAVTTNIAAAVGGLTAMIIAWIKYGYPSLSMTLNGILAGLVAVTAGCDLVTPFGAVCIGVIAGVVLVFAVSFIENTLKIDDPVGAASVHGCCGALGTILVGLFANGDAANVTLGLFYGGGFNLLGVQLIGVVAVAAWAVINGIIIFKIMKKAKFLRVNKRIEEEGLDYYEHGETAYNV